ncbi:hypothetical protein P8C59_005627 [Phyllachora maydis]|uniref:Uncharacterized protein n=1 Tax=Phyllachora maydis TaxID=1825666 RepID=A0AAD9I5S7_9PEZI|nr:hypothetical protein P8C59_005627 [Phyllachora maydis]
MAAVVTCSILLGLAGLLTPFLYERFGVLSLGYYNAPTRLPRHANFRSLEIRFADQIRNCEDVLLVESHQLALLACDPGRERWNTVMGIFQPEGEGEANANAGLYLYRYADASSPLRPVALAGFDGELRTLGLELDEASSTLYVVNHARAGSRLDLFHLDLAAATATWSRSIAHPLLHAPNSVALLGPGSLLVSNDHRFTARSSPRLLWMLETYLGLATGTVVHVRERPDHDGPGPGLVVDAAVVARQPYPNGVAVLNATTVAVAATNKAAVYLYTLTPAGGGHRRHPVLSYRLAVPVPFLPDNLSVDGETGALLIAGHPHVASLTRWAATRHLCHRPEAAATDMCASQRTGSWVAEWSEAGGLRHIYAGTDFATACTAVRHRRVGLAVGLYERGLMVWQEE